MVHGGARSGGIRTFKISNVLDLEVLDETFHHPVGFDLAAHWRDSMQRFERSLQRGHAEVRVARGAMSRLDRLSAAAMEAVVAAMPDADGWRHVTIPIESIVDAASALIAFGRDLEVIGPPELRAELARRAAAVVAMYS